MLRNNKGDTYIHNGVTYVVGGQIIGTSASAYAGLYGRILEIRDGEDMETENKDPDIYCSFFAPTDPGMIEAVEKRFSELYGSPKSIDDINLDIVIMAPDMIVPVNEQCPAKYMLVRVRNRDISTESFATEREAKEAMLNELKNFIDSDNKALIEGGKCCFFASDDGKTAWGFSERSACLRDYYGNDFDWVIFEL